MSIAGFIELSTIDYPEHVSCVVFYNGCNLRCPYCHNSQIAKGSENRVEMRVIREYLDRMEGQVTGIVLTGGEPTLSSISDLIHYAKMRGYDVKLDTNGTAKDLAKEPWYSLVDYVAVDLKLPPTEYRILGDNVNVELLEKNLKDLVRFRKNYEVRTTVHRKLLSLAGLGKIKTDWIDRLGLKNWYLQQYVKADGFDPQMGKEPTYTDDELTDLAIELGARVRNVAQNLVKRAEKRIKENGKDLGLNHKESGVQ